MALVKAVLRFCYDFIIGDDWKIAASVVTVLAAGATAVILGAGNAAVLAPLLAIGLGAAFTISMLVDTNPRPPRSNTG
jgi:hypothetical protein